MKRAIKETPILRGRDATLFLQNMKKASENKISREEYKRMTENYERMKAIEKF